MSSRRFMWLSYEMEVSYVYVNLCPDTTLLSKSVHMSSEHLCGACWGLCAVLCFFQPFLIWENTSPQRPTNGAGLGTFFSRATVCFLTWTKSQSFSFTRVVFHTSILILLLKYRISVHYHLWLAAVMTTQTTAQKMRRKGKNIGALHP